MDESVQVLEEKIARWKPESICVVGKSIWESIWRKQKGRGIKKDEFRYGWQDDRERMGKSEEWEGARVFVACSTSGLAATLSVAEKERIWSELGVWVEERREERGSIKVEQET
jgi:TDG/mug DNA glycosylase family protein